MLFLTSVSIASLARPWIGVVASYLIVLLTPQNIWWWNFTGLRPALWIMLSTMVGFAFAVLRRDYDFAILKNRRNLYLLLLWGFFQLSYVAGPYVDAGGPFRFTDPAWAASMVNNIFVLYFLASICIDRPKKLEALLYVIGGSCIYLIYWANDQYLSGYFTGRLPGPTRLGRGTYADENIFALFFVTTLPFLWFLGFTIERKLWRWALWLCVPLGWHAIFLTGSRGGLLGIAATIAVTVLRSERKAFAILLLPAFAVAFIWQAGDVMLERTATLSEYETEASAAGRLDAWGAATNMMARHPLTGVGLASFGPAFPDHSDARPREAHNTFFQIAGESGVIAGLLYLLIVLSCIRTLWANGKRLRPETGTKTGEMLYYTNEATLVGFIGLTVCSMFLSTQLFEIFYLMCLLVNVIVYIGNDGNNRKPAAVTGVMHR